MASPIENMKVIGKTAGSTLTNPLKIISNVSIANAFRNLGAWFESIGIGSRSFKGSVMAGGVVATNAVTFSSFVAGDTVTINGVVFTGSDTASTNVQIKTGGSDTTVAQSLVSLINSATAPAKVLGVLNASNVAGVVTINAIEPGAIGNLYTLAISAHGSVTGATFASGTDGTITLLAKGL
jgi:hypothetical protein